jgi:N-acetylglucosaminyl-diphospho-decaprenol L-rhamnosyltransferase
MATFETGGDPQPWVRVIIVNYNGGALLQPCVDALAVQTFRDFEAVVVDNASTDGSLDSLRVPDPRFKLIRNPSNVGFAAANNVGARGCRAPWLATLNPDTVAEPTWLEEMHKGTQRYADVCMFGATLVEAGDLAIVDGFGDALSIAGISWRLKAGEAVTSLPRGDTEVFSPCAAAALYARESYEEIGGFDEGFFCYLEDVDLGFRLRLQGGRCMQLRHAIVHHHGSGIAGKLSDFALFHSYRNRLWLIVKDMPLSLLSLAVPLNILCSVIIILKLRLAQGTPMAASLRGLLAGVPTPRLLKQRRVIQMARKISSMDVARHLVWTP